MGVAKPQISSPVASVVFWVVRMARKCITCQHVKRAEIDRRLAAGEPVHQVADSCGITRSSLHRHRVNCLKLASSNEVMKAVARGTAAAAHLPSREDLNGAYFDLRKQIDEVVEKAKAEGSLQIALSGLNSIRHTLDSLSRLVGFDRRDTNVNVAVQTNVYVDLNRVAARILEQFDAEPEIRTRIASALLEIEHAKPL